MNIFPTTPPPPEMAKPRTGHLNGTRYERHDKSVIAAVRAERQRALDEARDAALERERAAARLFDATAHVRAAK